MNKYDIFKMITKGIKFDHKRWKPEFQKIGMAPIDKDSLQPEGTDETETIKEETDVPDIDVDSPGNATEERKKQFSHEKLLQLKQEKINQLRNKNKIHIWGSDITDPVDSFDKAVDELKLNNRLVDNLRKEGYSSPTPIQMQAWPLMMQRRNILACAPTGSGKTAAFLVPIIDRLKGPRNKGFRAVIVSPTRELAKQIYRECVRLCDGYGMRPFIINNVKKAKGKFGPDTAQKFDILVTTPNRLIHLLQAEDEAPAINLSNVEWLVVDESDRLFEGGVKGFRDQMSIIYQACTNTMVNRAFFSATFAHELEHWCKLNLDNVAMVSVGARNSACKDVQQSLVYCGFENGKIYALKELFKKGFEPPVLIFVQTKERAKELFTELLYDANIMVDIISADRTQQQRDNTVRAFRERKIWVLICTELMSRGIDFKGVNLVINYDFPPSIVSYIHRIGRTGRANQAGKAITFWTMEDKEQLRSIAHIMKDSGSEVPDWILEMKKRKIKSNTKQPERGHVSSGVKHQNFLKRKENNKKSNLKKLKSKNMQKSSSDVDSGVDNLSPAKKNKRKHEQNENSNNVIENQNLIPKIKRNKCKT